MNTHELMKRALVALNKTQELLGSNLVNHRNPDDHATIGDLLGLHDSVDGLKLRRELGAALAAHVAPAARAEPADGWVLVPKRMTQEMRDVTDCEGWTWEDLLAEAGSISQEEYAAIAAAPVAPAQPLPTPPEKTA